MVHTSIDVMPTFEDVLDHQLQDPAFRTEWERTAPARALALRLVAYRAEHGLSQRALARKLGVSQPAVARMETGEHLPTLQTLAQIADALDIEVLIDITPAGRPSAWLSPEIRTEPTAERVMTRGGGEMLIAVG
ncbi:MAG TPA: helix-turn-helix transcriptional regulator [Thermomicrobiales bacterium]|nr:helix-turn-helix transcriptional regulator [Thermomicrobiales bacterium]